MDNLLEHYRDVQAGLIPTQIRGEPVWNTPERPLFKGWAFKNYLYKPFMKLTREWESVRVLDHGCGKAFYLHEDAFIGATMHRRMNGRLQSWYCYDPGHRPYMNPPEKGAKFNALISAGVMSVVPEKDIDRTFAEMRDWMEPDGIAFFKIPLTAKQERCFIGTNQSVYITVRPPEYWLEKLNTILCRRYYVTFADSPSKQIKYKRL